MFERILFVEDMREAFSVVAPKLTPRSQIGSLHLDLLLPGKDLLL